MICVIHHLSFPVGGDSINANIGDKELVLGRFDHACDAIRKLGVACLLIKLDVEAAYKQVPVRREDRALLGLQWEGKYYFELTLPFGLKSSGYRWEWYAAALHYFFEHHVGVELVIHYVDDFLFVVADHTLGERVKAEALALCKTLGVPMAEKKAEGPVTCLTFLGVELNTVTMTATLPAKKLARLRQLLMDWDTKSDCSIHDLQSLTGMLRWAANVVRPGRAWLRRLIALTTHWCRERGATDARGEQMHALPPEAKQDIRWWRKCIAQYNGVSLLYELEWQTAITMELYTDACYEQGQGGGYGAHWGNRWIQGRWADAQAQAAWRVKGHSIPFLELYALVLAVSTWALHWLGRKIILLCDCQPLVYACTSMESPDSAIQALLRIYP